MCGISGVAGPAWSQAQLLAMAQSQYHRGPDDSDTWISQDQFVGLGHNRLSIIDLSNAGHQPMADFTGRYRIIYNGEIYNYLELRQELSDYPFVSKSDTEVALASYIRWGATCLEKLIGMFAFVIWDSEQRLLFIARDRFGIKPLYYHCSNDGTIVLASEIKSIFNAGVPAIPDSTAWANYLAKGLYDHSERTFREGINSLPGGHFLTWQAGQKKLNAGTIWQEILRKSIIDRRILLKKSIFRS